jgi:hypothetical protein
VLADLARESNAHVSPASSLKYLHCDSSKVPDLRINDVILDFEQINVTAPSSFDNYGKPKPVLQYAENSKSKKHGFAVERVNCSFLPFIQDCFGSLAPQASSFFNNLVNQIDVDTFLPPNFAALTPASFWTQSLSVSLWRNNAREFKTMCIRCWNKRR